MLGVTQPHEKCAIEMKEGKKKRRPRKTLFDGRKEFVWLLQKLDVTDFDELQVDNSSHTKAPFRHTNGHHKTRNGWYLGLVVPISSIVGLLILELEHAESSITKR